MLDLHSTVRLHRNQSAQHAHSYAHRMLSPSYRRMRDYLEVRLGISPGSPSRRILNHWLLRRCCQPSHHPRRQQCRWCHEENRYGCDSIRGLHSRQHNRTPACGFDYQSPTLSRAVDWDDHLVSTQVPNDRIGLMNTATASQLLPQ